MADAQEFQVTMARATDEDIKAVREFLDYMEEQAEDFVPDPFGLVQRYNDAAASFERIVLGYQVLRDSLCDPSLSYLDVRPEIKAMEAAAKEKPDGTID